MLFSVLFRELTRSIVPDWGLGQHYLDIDAETRLGHKIRFYIANAAYIMSTSLIKISLLFQYLRLYENLKCMRTTTKTSIYLVAAWGLAGTFISWVPCFPVRAYWDESVSGKCYGYGSKYQKEYTMTFEGHAATNLMLDILVFALPIPTYFRRGTETRTKMGLLALFAMGGVVVFISIWRLVTIVEHKSATQPTYDPSWYSPITIMLGAIEVDIASICASVPVFWPILRERVNGIFVTQEIQIVREDRVNGLFEMQRGHSGADSRQGTGTDGGSSDRNFHSPQGSEVCFNGASSLESGEKMEGVVGPPGSANNNSSFKDKTRYYQDEYVQKQVNPFLSHHSSAEDKEALVDTHVRSKKRSDSKGGLRTFFLP